MEDDDEVESPVKNWLFDCGMVLREMRMITEQRSSVPAFQRSSVVDMFVDALHRFTQVRELWQTVTSFYEGRAHMRDVLDSVLEGATDKYCVDSRELNVRVPDLLMRECEDEIHRVSDLHSRVTRVEIKSVYKTEIGNKNDHPIPCKYVNIDDEQIRNRTQHKTRQ